MPSGGQLVGLHVSPHLSADMSDEESITRAVQTVSEKIGDGGLNLLINNAAIAKPALPGKLCDTSRQDMMDNYETNVAGPFLLTKVDVVFIFFSSFFLGHVMHIYTCD